MKYVLLHDGGPDVKLAGASERKGAEETWGYQYLKSRKHNRELEMELPPSFD